MCIFFTDKYNSLPHLKFLSLCLNPNANENIPKFIDKFLPMYIPLEHYVIQGVYMVVHGPFLRQERLA